MRTMTRSPVAALLAVALCSTATLAQRDSLVSAPISSVRYEVTATSERLGERQLGISTSFDVSGTGVVLLSLPAWTPGAYEISNFARNVGAFAASQDGADLRWDKVDKDTWRLHPAKAGRVTVT